VSTFTPGPWVAEDHSVTDLEDGLAVIAVFPEHPRDTPTRGMVAWLGDHGANFQAPETRAANARLIAAAPDLLAALKALLDKADLNDWNQEAYEAAEAAIAKADGR
jgi:hypothetical protein